MTLREAAQDFLAQKRIAVVGVSRDSKQAGNFVFRKLRDLGYDVFPVNPHASEVEGTHCFQDVGEVRGGVEAVLIFTPPKVTASIVRRCGELGIRRVWIHQTIGTGSLSNDAVAAAREYDLTLIPGGCPAMFCDGADTPHRCMRWLLDVMRKLPREVAAHAS